VPIRGSRWCVRGHGLVPSLVEPRDGRAGGSGGLARSFRGSGPARGAHARCAEVRGVWRGGGRQRQPRQGQQEVRETARCSDAGRALVAVIPRSSWSVVPPGPRGSGDTTGTWCEAIGPRRAPATPVRPERRTGASRGARRPEGRGVVRRAGDGNRTRVASLEDWGSTIELRPRGSFGHTTRVPREGAAEPFVPATCGRNLSKRAEPLARPVVRSRPSHQYTCRCSPVPTGVRGVAQVGSASALGAEGRRFKSCHPDIHPASAVGDGLTVRVRWDGCPYVRVRAMRRARPRRRPWSCRPSALRARAVRATRTVSSPAARRPAPISWRSSK
jgi:hypothetical protein